MATIVRKTCPTCDHIMRRFDGAAMPGFYCSRCGTLEVDGKAFAPEIVQKSQSMVETFCIFHDRVEGELGFVNDIQVIRSTEALKKCWTNKIDKAIKALEVS